MSNVGCWILLLLIPRHFHVAAVDINEAYYVDGTVNYTYFYDAFEIQVESYKGIIGAKAEIETRDFDGHASFGLYDVGTLEITRYADCNGDYSCAVTEYLNISSWSECYGAGSCSYNDHFSCECSYDWLVTNGAFSLGNSYIYDTSPIYADGAFTLMNSVVDSKGSISSLSMYLYGFGAGYNATIVCREGDRCTIRCYGYGCFGTIVVCETNATCSTDCDSSQATYCPFVINGDYNDDVDYNDYYNDYNLTYDDLFAVPWNQSGITIALEILLWYSELVDIMDEYDWKCNLDTSIRFDVYNTSAHDATNGTLVIENSTNSKLNFVCCRGYRSCAPGGGSSYTSLSSISTYGTIYCGAYAACSNAASDGITMEGKSRNANVMCSGYDSCVGTIINTTGNVTCSGYISCEGFKLHNANALFCTATGACNDGMIYGVSNIYMMAHTSSDQDMLIYSNNTQFNNALYDDDNEKDVINVHFLAYRSGFDVTIYCHATQICNIYCHVPDACDPDRTKIYCYGLFLFFVFLLSFLFLFVFVFVFFVFLFFSRKRINDCSTANPPLLFVVNDL